MLFDRFVFVLHLLFCYNWFLLGTQLSLSIGYIPIISLLATLSSISIVTGYQLQTILHHGALKQHEKWETMIWCCVHISLTMLIIADWLQLANIVVIGLMAGFELYYDHASGSYDHTKNGRNDRRVGHCRYDY